MGRNPVYEIADRGASRSPSAAGAAYRNVPSLGVRGKAARTRREVMSHWGITQTFTAPGGPHFGHHHRPSDPQVQTPRPRSIPAPPRTSAPSGKRATSPRGARAWLAGRRRAFLPPQGMPQKWAMPYCQAYRASSRNGYRTGRNVARWAKMARARHKLSSICSFSMTWALTTVGVYHGAASARRGPRCAAPGASRPRPRPHVRVQQYLRGQGMHDASNRTEPREYPREESERGLSLQSNLTRARMHTYQSGNVH